MNKVKLTESQSRKRLLNGESIETTGGPRFNLAGDVLDLLSPKKAYIACVIALFNYHKMLQLLHSFH